MTDRLATLCVHAGEITDPHGSPHTPLYTATTFKFPTICFGGQGTVP